MREIVRKRFGVFICNKTWMFQLEDSPIRPIFCLESRDRHESIQLSSMADNEEGLFDLPWYHVGMCTKPDKKRKRPWLDE